MVCRIIVYRVIVFRPSIEDLVGQKVDNGKTVSVAGIAAVISDLITMGSEGKIIVSCSDFLDGKGMASHDRELLLSSPSGTTIRVMLHGQSAKSISCEEEGTEVYFGPMKVVGGYGSVVYCYFQGVE